jgi:membrane protease YdiL (CAAX protease family)
LAVAASPLPVPVPAVAPDPAATTTVGDVSLPVNESGNIVGGLPLGRARRSLVLETRWVMVAFLTPVVMSAVLVFAEHVSGVGDVSRFPSIVHGHPVTNMVLGIFAYAPVAATVPLALFLLSRTGQDREVLGLGVPRFKRDIFPGLGLGAAAFGCEMVILIPFAQFMVNHRSLFVSVTTQHVPKYYVIWGLVISAVTAITEEVLVNGYLITRLGQLGWTPRKSLILSLILRTSYHVYYGIGFILTVPFGFFVTRSFQKHHKLNRPIVAHFLFDAILITISILR